jgi:hypothetical protein
MKSNSTPRSRGKPKPCSANVTTLSLGADLLTLAPVRLILRKVDVSPSVAAVLAEHAGLLRDARNG